MDNINKITVVAVAFLLLIFSMNSCVGLGDDDNMMMSDHSQTEAAAESKTPIIDAAKRLFSLPTASDSWYLKLKALIQQGWPTFSPPNLDFREGSGSDKGTVGKEGAMEKVKEAVVKSLDKSKATVEGSAKSTARFAEDAVDKTVKNLKKTLSRKGRQEVGKNQEAEL